MSLFHLSEWYNGHFPGAISLVVAQLIDDRDQLIVGSLEGTLTVIDPGGNVEQRYDMGVIVEMDLNMAVLQVAVGRFLTSFNQQLIVALHPNTIAYFRLTSNDIESYFLERVFEHRISGDPSFNLCQGFFGSSHIEQLCVQSINCQLNIFESENRVMSYQIEDAIFPGPIQYTTISDSLLFVSGSHLTSTRYASLTACATHSEAALYSSGMSVTRPNIKKKLHVDWCVNFGDTPLDINVIHVVSIQPSVVVLCKRAVFCLTHGGSVRYVIRLQSVATCMTINHTNKDTEIQICVGLSAKTLMFYHDSKVVWRAQLSFAPIYVNIASFTESLRCLLTLLSDDDHVFIGYLGVQPSLSQMPVTETRHLDFELRRKKLREFEEIIWRAGHENGEVTPDTPNLQLFVDVKIDEKSMAYDIDENVPSATVLLEVSEIRDRVDVIFQADIYFEKTHFSFTSTDTGKISISTFCKNCPTLDLRAQIVAVTNTAAKIVKETLIKEVLLPLRLICHQTVAQRTATFKLSLDSSETCLGVSQIFDDFELDNDTSVGLQPYFSDAVVSIFVSSKTNRYRIQSNSTDFLFVVLSELVRRLRARQSSVRLHCPLPTQLVLNAITTYLQSEDRRDKVQSNVSRLAVQMRQAETILLGKLKSDREPFAPHLSALINYSYRELMNTLDELADINSQLNSKQSTSSLRAVINLASAVLELSSKLKLPFDGRIIDGADMKLGVLIKRLLNPDAIETTDVEEVVNADEVGRILMSYCERSMAAAGRDYMAGTNTLVHVPEEEDEWEKTTADCRLDSPHNDEFLELRSGSMAANVGLGSIC